MKWINHLAIAGATTALVAPALVPVALLGSTAPDWLEWVLEKLGGRKVKHRGVTHVVLYWAGGLAFALGLWDFHGILAAFAYGGLTHVLADSLTVSGVPFTGSSRQRYVNHHRILLHRSYSLVSGVFAFTEIGTVFGIWFRGRCFCPSLASVLRGTSFRKRPFSVFPFFGRRHIDFIGYFSF